MLVILNDLIPCLKLFLNSTFLIVTYISDHTKKYLHFCKLQLLVAKPQLKWFIVGFVSIIMCSNIEWY